MDTDSMRMDEASREFQARLGPQIEAARENLSQVNRKVTTFIKENPTTCLLGALALGFIVGKIASRR